MALALYDRVQQTGTANTTVSFTLSGSVLGYQSFSVVGNGNTTYYSATDNSGNWEVGLGTYSTTGPTLTRTTIFSSSNSGSAVTFSGTVNVFVTYPAGKSVNLDGTGNFVAGVTSTNAIQAQQTDSTATGGNARGSYATDFQKTRTAAGQVASGYASFIGAGETNTGSGYDSVVVGGASNTSNGLYTFTGCGYNNNAGGATGGTVVNGYGNNANGFWNFIGGGAFNTGTSASAVTTQATTTVTSGSTAVTLSGSNASIKVGQLITGTGITTFPHTYVAAISGTSLTLSQIAAASGSPTLSFYTPHGIVVGGGNNQATGSYSFVGGGGDAGTATNRNKATGDWATVVGGIQNTASGISSFVGCGGNYGGGFAGNSATGTATFVGGGYLNGASGYASSVIGGSGNQSNSNFTTVLGGANANTRSIIGYMAFNPSSSPISSSNGVQQIGWLSLGRQTTDATATVLTSDSLTAGTGNQVILPNNSAYYFRGEVISGVTGGGNTKGWYIEGVIKRGANAASTALVGTPTVTSNYADAGASTWTIAVTADTTNGGLAVTFTGQAATTIRTVAQIRTTEMTY